MAFEPIKDLDIYVQNILPAVYDESLSYYELLAKIANQINELTHVVNLYGGQIEDEVRAMLNEWLTDGTMAQIINEEIFESIQNQLADPRYFGAIGDGTTDDGDALETWLLTPSKSKVLRNGTFVTSKPLLSSESYRDIKSEGGTLKGITQDMIVLTVTGDYTCVEIDIDGDNVCAMGIYVDGAKGCRISGCNIRDLYGITIGGCGIKAETNLGIMIEHNSIVNVDSILNGTFGDNVGASRGILLGDKLNGNAVEHSTIYDNYIDNIVGEEGDGIQVLFYDGISPTFLDGLCDIKGNTIKNVNRRAVKVQANKVTVRNNKHINNLNNLPNAASVLEVLNSHDVMFDSNQIDATGGFMGISAQGTSGVVMENIVIIKNIVLGHATKDGMYLNSLIDPIIEDNIVHDGGRAITIGNATHGTVSRNKIFGGDGTNTGINISQTCAYLLVQGNTGHATDRTSLVTVSAPYCLVSENHNDTGVCVTSSSTAGRSILKNNTNYSNESPTYNGDFSTSLKSDGFNVGGGGSGTGVILYGTGAPTVHNFNQGDIVLNTAVTTGSNVGWVCIASGSPGTWKTWGVVS